MGHDHQLNEHMTFQHALESLTLRDLLAQLLTAVLLFAVCLITSDIRPTFLLSVCAVAVPVSLMIQVLKRFLISRQG